MIRYKTYTIIFLALSLHSIAQQQVTLLEAKTAAISAIKAHTNQKDYTLSSIAKVNIFKDSNLDTLLYEVIFSNNKAVLLSGSKACVPILGYYDISDGKSILDFSSKESPCCLKSFIQEYAEQITYAFAHKTMPLYFGHEWQNLQSQSQIRSTTTIIVAPLTTSAWGQSWSNDGYCVAYNYYVDEDDNSCNDCPTDKCPVGCTAVAMGQIMKYWNYPVYIPEKTEQYDWCNMPDELNYYGNSNYAIEQNAIARLLKDCAESVNANYCIFGTCQTSALILSARNALKNKFGYSDDANWEPRSSYTLSNWKNKIKNNLDDSIPVLYQSPGTNADGHAFICDGYNSNDEFHFNWGHNGADYGWFALNAIEYDDAGGEHHNYNYAQEAVFDIHPANTQDYCDFSMPLYIHYYFYYTILQETFPPPYFNVPRTNNNLVSVPETFGDGTLSDASWRTIPTGAPSEYVAHKEVRLLAGFHAQAGSYFRAYIDPCESCGEMKNSSMLNNPLNEDDVSEEYNRLLKQGKYSDFTALASEKEETVKLYPNPNNGTFTIETTINPQEIVSVQVVNMLGKLVYTQQGLSNSPISIPTASKGVYVVKVATQHNTYIRKIVVQ